MIELDGVTVRFGDTVVLDDVSTTVADDEIVGLLGPSGSGKSTLLRVVAGVLRPDAGTVRLGGVDVTDVPTYRRDVGMVFQDDQLFPHLDVTANVAFGLKMKGVERRRREATAAAWLERVGLRGFGPRRVTELSGGEAKRVALARTLVVEPAVVLLDEPLTGLDRELHDELAAELGPLLRTAGATAILVTHDVAEADAVADRTVQLGSLS